MSSQLGLTFAMPMMASRKQAGIKYIRGVIGGLKGSKTPDNCIPPGLRGCDSPLSTPSEQCDRDLDRVLNPDLSEDEGFTMIHDEEICPIDYTEDFKVEDDVNATSCLFKHVSPVDSIQSDEISEFNSSDCSFSTANSMASQRDSKSPIASMSFRAVQVATSGAKSTAMDAGHRRLDGIRSGNASRPTPHDHATTTDEIQVLCADRKRPLFQPPPLDGEFSNDEDDEDDQGDSDGWTAIGIDSDDDDLVFSWEKPVPTCRKTKTDPDHATSELHNSPPRIHPLCAAKYGDFFKAQAE